MQRVRPWGTLAWQRSVARTAAARRRRERLIDVKPFSGRRPFPLPGATSIDRFSLLRGARLPLRGLQPIARQIQHPPSLRPLPQPCLRTHLPPPSRRWLHLPTPPARASTSPRGTMPGKNRNRDASPRVRYRSFPVRPTRCPRSRNAKGAVKNPPLRLPYPTACSHASLSGERHHASRKVHTSPPL